MEADQVNKIISALKKDLEKIYPDMSAEMPVDSTPDSIDKVKKMAAVASSNSMSLALNARALSQYIKQKEAAITLEHIKAKDLMTPKEDHLKACLKAELSEVYAYSELCNRMLELCKQRVMLAQTFLRNSQQESYSGKMEF